MNIPFVYTIKYINHPYNNFMIMGVEFTASYEWANESLKKTLSQLYENSVSKM